MTQPAQHLTYAYDNPYLVTWRDSETDCDLINAVVRRADSDCVGTWADDPKTLTFTRAMVDEVGRKDTIEQTLASLAPVRPSLVNA